MFVQELGKAEMVCVIKNVLEDGDWAILEWKSPLGLRGYGFFHVIELQRGHWDQLSILRQQKLPRPSQ